MPANLSVDAGNAACPLSGMNAQTAAITAPSTQDAVQFLSADHRQIEALLADCARASVEGGAPADRAGLLGRLAVRLRAHETIDHELFYPALKGFIDADVLERAAADHQRIDKRLEAIASSDADPSAAVAELAQWMRQHVQFEERELFAAAASALDLSALGTALALRRAKLLGGDEGAD
jgi:Hemerythrin HHE cation binding domain